MSENSTSKEVDVSSSFLDVVKKLQDNSIPFYITGSLAMDFYLKGYLDLIIPDRDDVDIVVSKASAPSVEKVFGRQFAQKDNPDGTKVTYVDLGNKVDISLFNDFVVAGSKLDFSSNPEIFSETQGVEFSGSKFRIANKRLLLALKLALFRGKSIETPCDKRDIFHFKKYNLLDTNIKAELMIVIPKLVRDQRTVHEIMSVLMERYESVA